ncbi:MAG: two-component regulator propeller domain-containing protein, partial [Bacteroidota bacterium]
MGSARLHIVQLLLIVSFIAGWESSLGQNISTQPYRFKSISVNDNLSHSNVNTIVQDSLGYIWIGTNNGLNRFDGYEISTFKFDLQNSHSPPGNRVKAMVVDKAGSIWISFENKGLYRFDPTEWRFQKIPLTHPKRTIIRMVMDQAGDIWIHQAVAGLTKFCLRQDASVKEIRSYPRQQILGGEIDTEIGSLNASEGRVYFHTNRKDIWTYDKKTDTFSPLYRADELGLADSELIGSLCKDGESMWVGTNQRLFRIKRTLKGLQRETLSFTASTGLISRIYKDQFQRIWCSTGIGLFMLDFQNGDQGSPDIIQYAKNKRNSQGILSNRIICFLEDRFGVIWLGSHSGVNYTNLRRKAFVHVGQYLGESNFSKENHVSAIVKHQDGRIWIGTNSGLYILPSEHQVRHDYVREEKPSYPIQDNINFIFRDQKQ